MPVRATSKPRTRWKGELLKRITEKPVEGDPGVHAMVPFDGHCKRFRIEIRGGIGSLGRSFRPTKSVRLSRTKGCSRQLRHPVVVDRLRLERSHNIYMHPYTYIHTYMSSWLFICIVSHPGRSPSASVIGRSDSHSRRPGLKHGRTQLPTLIVSRSLPRYGVES